MIAQDTLTLILDEIRAQNQNDQDLWDAESIGRYMGLKKSTVQSKILCKETFPTAIRLPTSEKGLGGRRWLAAEVRAWVMKHKEAR